MGAKPSKQKSECMFSYYLQIGSGSRGPGKFTFTRAQHLTESKSTHTILTTENKKSSSMAIESSVELSAVYKAFTLSASVAHKFETASETTTTQVAGAANGEEKGTSSQEERSYPLEDGQVLFSYVKVAVIAFDDGSGAQYRHVPQSELIHQVLDRDGLHRLADGPVLLDSKSWDEIVDFWNTNTDDYISAPKLAAAAKEEAEAIAEAKGATGEGEGGAAKTAALIAAAEERFATKKKAIEEQGKDIKTVDIDHMRSKLNLFDVTLQYGDCVFLQNCYDTKDPAFPHDYLISGSIKNHERKVAGALFGFPPFMTSKYGSCDVSTRSVASLYHYGGHANGGDGSAIWRIVSAKGHTGSVMVGDRIYLENCYHRGAPVPSYLDANGPSKFSSSVNDVSSAVDKADSSIWTIETIRSGAAGPTAAAAEPGQPVPLRFGSKIFLSTPGTGWQGRVRKTYLGVNGESEDGQYAKSDVSTSVFVDYTGESQPLQWAIKHEPVTPE